MLQSVTMKEPNQPKDPGYVAGMSEKELREKYDVGEIVKIGSNENPLGPSPMAVEVMNKLTSGLHRYPPMKDDSFRIAIANALGRGITPEHVVTGNGGCDILSMMANAFLGKGDECTICRPTFPAHEFLARRNGADVIYADLELPSFTYNINAILDAVTDKTRVVFLCSPNNPTGSVLTGTDFNTLVDELPGSVVVVLDEVYHHFVTEDDRPDPITAVTQGKPVIAVHSFSKAFGLAGCRLGYGIAAPGIIEQIRRFTLPFHINNVSLEAGIAALGDKDHLDNTVKAVIEGRSYVYDKLREIGADAWPSQGNFVLFKTSFPAEAISEGLQQRGVIVRPMDLFYLPGHLRVSVGRRADNDRFIEALVDTQNSLT